MGVDIKRLDFIKEQLAATNSLHDIKKVITSSSLKPHTCNIEKLMSPRKRPSNFVPFQGRCHIKMYEAQAIAVPISPKQTHKNVSRDHRMPVWCLPPVSQVTLGKPGNFWGICYFVKEKFTSFHRGLPNSEVLLWSNQDFIVQGRVFIYNAQVMAIAFSLLCLNSLQTTQFSEQL